MALIGSMDRFDDATESFISYTERIEQFFVANYINNDKKVAVLISVIGKKTYGILRDLCSPDRTNDKSYDQIIELLSTHYKPRYLEVAESHHFRKIIQNEGESLASFAVRLRHAATTCNFADHLDRSLRDQFISGVRLNA